MTIWGALRAAGRLPAAACLALAATGATASRNSQPPGESVIVFLIDNSASLPSLDSRQKRREALDEILSSADGQPYRLVLFGGRKEISEDSPARHEKPGQWTDFYFAFERVRQIAQTYPGGTTIKVILVTDGILDPCPADWADRGVPDGTELKQFVGQRVVALLEEMRLPLYVIVIGDEANSELILAMVRAANGPVAGHRYTQRLSDFFRDDGVLLRRFIYQVEPEQGVAHIEPIVRRIAARAEYRVELSIVTSLLLFIAVLVGMAVRSFPGPGDQEVIELRLNDLFHIAVDRFRRLPSHVPSWSWHGLCLVDSATRATATLRLLPSDQKFPPEGVDLDKVDEPFGQLMCLDLPALRRKMDQIIKGGSKEEMVEVLNLDYVGSDLDPARAEAILVAPPAERSGRDPLEFLRAKVHLLHDESLRSKLTAPRVICTIYGSDFEKRELRVDDSVKLGRYIFTVSDVAPGGRKGYRLTLTYEGVPSPLWLKRLVPKIIQRVIRFRRSHERIVG